MYALHKHTKGIFSICSIQYTVNRQYHPESAVSMCVFVHYAFICTFKDICSLDTYHLIIFAAHMQISHKNSKSRCQLVYILVIDVILYYLLIFEHTLLWRLLWVYLPKNLLVCVLAEFNCCAQTTLCVNSSLVVGGIYPCVRFYVCVDWWGHSRVPGLLTTSCFPLPSAPVPSSHCSMPASFNLAVKAKENRSKSHQGTLLFFKDHAYAPPIPRHLVSLLCPHPSPLPVLQFFLPAAFILTSPVSLAVLTLWTESNERQKRTVMMQNTLSFYLCYPVFRLDRIETVFFLFLFCSIWNFKYYWEYSQDKPSLWVSVIRLIFFFFCLHIPPDV